VRRFDRIKRSRTNDQDAHKRESFEF
jgi:hypothetical protein